MSFGELIGQLVGWLGEFVEWLISFVPRYEIVQFNERGVKYIRGRKPVELQPGVRWYWPWCTEIEKHHVCSQTLEINAMALETKEKYGDDGETIIEEAQDVEVGCAIVYRIVDVLKYEVDNLDADDNMADVAQGALRDIVMEFTWSELTEPTEEGRRLETKLSNRMSKALERFGVEVETCRPTDQCRRGIKRGAIHIFGLDASTSLSIGS